MNTRSQCLEFFPSPRKLALGFSSQYTFLSLCGCFVIIKNRKLYIPVQMERGALGIWKGLTWRMGVGCTVEPYQGLEPGTGMLPGTRAALSGTHGLLMFAPPAGCPGACCRPPFSLLLGTQWRRCSWAVSLSLSVLTQWSGTSVPSVGLLIDRRGNKINQLGSGTCLI